MAVSQLEDVLDRMLTVDEQNMKNIQPIRDILMDQQKILDLLHNRVAKLEKDHQFPQVKSDEK
jgi:hypothetical protein